MKVFHVTVNYSYFSSKLVNVENFSCSGCVQSSDTCEITKPTQLQMYTWQIVSSLQHDVVGIGPPKEGKTLSYLVPLIGMLEGAELYRQLPRFGIGVSLTVLSACIMV